MIGNQRGFGDLVVDTRAEVKTCDVSRGNRRLLGEQLQSGDEKNCATEGAET